MHARAINEALERCRAAICVSAPNTKLVDRPNSDTLATPWPITATGEQSMMHTRTLALRQESPLLSASSGGTLARLCPIWSLQLDHKPGLVVDRSCVYNNTVLTRHAEVISEKSEAAALPLNLLLLSTRSEFL